MSKVPWDKIKTVIIMFVVGFCIGICLGAFYDDDPNSDRWGDEELD